MPSGFFWPPYSQAVRFFGAYAPFGLGFVAAAGAGMEGLSALLGLLVGALFDDALHRRHKIYCRRHPDLFGVRRLFDTKLYRKHAFLPLITAACTAVVGFVYLMPQGVFNTDGAYFLLEIFLAGGCAVCYRMALAIQIDAPETLERQQLFALFVLAISLLIAVAAIPLAGRFSLGRIFFPSCWYWLPGGWAAWVWAAPPDCALA